MKKIIWIIVIVGVLGGAIWWGQMKNTSVADKPIKIGVILPLTGNAANYGEQLKQGIDIALKQINETPEGRKIEVVYEDNQFDPKQGLSAYQKLVKFQSIRYLVTFGGNVCPVINPRVQEDLVVNFATGCNTLDFKDPFSYNFRFDVAESEASNALVSYMNTTIKPKKVALLYLNNDWGTIVAETIKKALANEKIEIIAEEKFNDGSLDVRNQLAKIKAVQPDAIFFLSLSNFTPVLLKQVKELGIKTPLFTNISIQNQEVINNAGGNAEGIAYSAPKLEQAETSRNVPFNAAFPDPNSRNFASWGFDSIHLFADAFNAVGENPEKVADYLHQVKNYAGAFGVINYDVHGELKLNYVIKTIKDGKFVEIQ